MGPGSSTCHSFGDPIPSSGLEKKRAITLLKRHYCGDCADQIASGGARGIPASRGTARRVVAGLMALAGNRDRRPRLRILFLLAVAVGPIVLLALLCWSWARDRGIHP